MKELEELSLKAHRSFEHLYSAEAIGLLVIVIFIIQYVRVAGNSICLEAICHSKICLLRVIIGLFFHVNLIGPIVTLTTAILAYFYFKQFGPLILCACYCINMFFTFAKSFWGLSDVVLLAYCYYLSRKIIVIYDFFLNITAVPEEEYVKRGCKFDDERKESITNILTEQKFSTGKLNSYSIGELMDSAKMLAREGPMSPMKFLCLDPLRLLEQPWYRSSIVSPLKEVDYAYLQTKFWDATFHIPTKFNGHNLLHNYNESDADITPLQNLVYDLTSASDISLGAIPGTIRRTYGGDNANMLENLAEYFAVEDGLISLKNTVSFPKDVTTQTDMMRRIQILSHTDVQVLYGHSCGGLIELIKNKTVHHACAGGIKMSDELRRHPDIRTIIQFFLDASYQGVYLTAIRENKKRVVLMLYEQERWGVYTELQVQAMVKAHERWGQYVEEAWFVYSRNTTIHPELKALLTEKKIPFKITSSIEENEPSEISGKTKQD